MSVHRFVPKYRPDPIGELVRCLNAEYGEEFTRQTVERFVRSLDADPAQPPATARKRAQTRWFKR